MGYAQIQVATAVAAGRRWMENGSDLVAPTRPQMRVLLDTLDEQARELERLRKVEAAARDLLAGEFQSRDHAGWVEFTERRVSALRRALGGSS